MKKLLQKIFFGYSVLETTQSSFNGRILVEEDLLGHRRLVVGGLTQSGKKVENLWKDAFVGFRICDLRFKSCLILGLGAGSAARLISMFYPKVKITGVEIDPEIIAFGKKYFELGRIPNLEVKIADAIGVINNQPRFRRACRGEAGPLRKRSEATRLDSVEPRRSRQLAINNSFDLILVDLYLGDQFPKEAESEDFLRKIQKIMSENGVIIFNRLYYGQKIEKTDEFERKIEKFFKKIEAKKISMNKLFLCRNEEASWNF